MSDTHVNTFIYYFLFSNHNQFFPGKLTNEILADEADELISQDKLTGVF